MDISLIERYGSFGLIALIIIGLGIFISRYIPLLLSTVNAMLTTTASTFESTLKNIREDFHAQSTQQSESQGKEREMFLTMISEQRQAYIRELELHRITTKENFVLLAEQLGRNTELLRQHDLFIRWHSEVLENARKTPGGENR